MGKVLNPLLPLAIVENAEVILGQFRSHCSFLVKDDDLDSDEVCFRADVIHAPMLWLPGSDDKSKGAKRKQN